MIRTDSASCSFPGSPARDSYSSHSKMSCPGETSPSMPMSPWTHTYTHKLSDSHQSPTLFDLGRLQTPEQWHYKSIKQFEMKLCTRPPIVDLPIPFGVCFCPFMYTAVTLSVLRKLEPLWLSKVLGKIWSN